MFIFDVFASAERLVAFEVNRKEEFSPLKNAPGAPQDSPNTCRHDLSALCQRWLQLSGANVETPSGVTCDDMDEMMCEVSPLLASSGSDLKDLEKKSVRCKKKMTSK